MKPYFYGVLKIGYKCDLCEKQEWVESNQNQNGWIHFAWEACSQSRTAYKTVCPECAKEIFGTITKLRKKES